MRGDDEMERKAGFPAPVRNFTLIAWALAMLGLQFAGGICLFLNFERLCR